MVSFLPRTKQYNKKKCLEVKIYSSMISPFEDNIYSVARFSPLKVNMPILGPNAYLAAGLIFFCLN